MTEIRGSGERIRDLRTARGETQVAFASSIGVGQPQVSAWEVGSDGPSSGAYVRLGNLAPYPDNLWFWEQAGIDAQAMLSASEKLLKERNATPAAGETVHIPCKRKTRQGEEPLEHLLAVPVEHAPNPGSTVCLVIDTGVSSPWAPSGDLVILDTSEMNTRSLQPFWDRVVLIEVDPREPNDPLAGRLVMGRLRYKRLSPPPSFIGPPSHIPGPLPRISTWLATIGPLGDSGIETDGQSRGVELIVGRWEPRASDDPDVSEPIIRYMQLLDILRQQADKKIEAQLATLESKVSERAPEKIRLKQPTYRILGIVNGWFRKQYP